MPNNTLTPAQMNTILQEQFREVEALGFTADGVNNVFRTPSQNEANFRAAAQAICDNKDLIETIFSSCSAIEPKNLELILQSKGIGCAAVIEKLCERHLDLSELAKTGKFSGSNFSSIVFVPSAKKTIKNIDVLVNNSNSLTGFIESTEFSPSNISSMLNKSGSKLDKSINALVSNKERLKALIDKGFSASNISTILHGSGAQLGKSINVLIQHQAEFRALYQSGSTLKDIRIKLREYVKQLPEQTEHSLPVEQAAQEAVIDPHYFLKKSSVGQTHGLRGPESADVFFTDLSCLLLALPSHLEDRLLQGVADSKTMRLIMSTGARLVDCNDVLTTHRETLFQLHATCGFSAHNIADILQGSRGNLDQAIWALNRLKPKLFRLINEGHFTADQLAEKLRGGSEKVGQVFLKDAEVRAALHASHQNAQAKPKATIPDVEWLDDFLLQEMGDSATSLGGGVDELDAVFFEDAAMAVVADDFSLEGNFFEKDDTDRSLLSFDSQELLPAAKRPRFA